MRVLSKESRFGEVWQCGDRALKLIPVQWNEDKTEWSDADWIWSQHEAEKEIRVLTAVTDELGCHVLDVYEIREYDYRALTGRQRYYSPELKDAPLAGLSVSMELASGTARQLAPLSRVSAVQLLCTLTVLQQAGLVHGDMHTNNILAVPQEHCDYQYRIGRLVLPFFQRSEKLVLADFGHARFDSIAKRSVLRWQCDDVEQLATRLSEEGSLPDMSEELELIRACCSSAAPTTVPAHQLLVALVKRLELETDRDYGLQEYGCDPIYL